MTGSLLLTELTHQFTSETSPQIYVLLDAAQFQAVWSALKQRYKSVQWLSLLEKTGSEAAIKASPLLLLIDKQHVNVLEWLLSESKNSYFLSWMTSSLPFHELRDHLSGLLDVEIEDAGNWVMRYFDTRILPVWYSVLSETQKAHVNAPIQDWGYIDRFGQTQHIKGTGQNSAPPPQTFKLTPAQENTLLAAAYPDAILQQLHNNENAELMALAKAQQYPYIATQIQKAQSLYQIETMPDTILYCSLALVEGEAFDMKAPYQELLSRVVNNEGGFGELFMSHNKTEENN